MTTRLKSCRIIREYAAGRKRLDLCLVYKGNKYAIELKLRYGPKTEADGLQQLGDYMDTVAAQEGWLIIFDRDPDKAWDEKITWRTEQGDDHTIHLIGCWVVLQSSGFYPMPAVYIFT